MNKKKKIMVNYCFNCKQEFKTYSGLKKHFQTKKHKENSK